MDSEIIKAHKKAGVIWSSAIKLVQKKAKADANLFELAESIENYIREEGATPAFPINLSRNEEAAHFTPKFNDTITLKETDVLKIDIGVAVDGYICDGAITVNLDNKHAKQIEANTLALENAISVAKFGKPVERMGAEIERTFKSKQSQTARVERIDNENVLYTCPKCKYEFKFNVLKRSPGRCSYCGAEISGV